MQTQPAPNVSTAHLPRVITINGKLYGYGRDKASCHADFARNISGATGAMRTHLRDYATVQVISDEQASEIEEMLAADVLRWDVLA